MEQSEAIYEQVKRLLNDKYKHDHGGVCWWEVENDNAEELLQLLQLLLPCRYHNGLDYSRNKIYTPWVSWVSLNGNATLYKCTHKVLLEAGRLGRAWDFDFFEIEKYYEERDDK